VAALCVLFSFFLFLSLLSLRLCFTWLHRRVPTSVLAFALHPTFITALSTPDVGYVDARRVAFRLSCLWTVPSLPTGPPHPVVPNFPPLASKFWPPIVQMGLLERSLSVHFKTRDNRSTETHASGFSAYQKAMGRRPILLPHLFPRLPSFHVARCTLTLRSRSPPSRQPPGCPS
jgi:hypothetical protein